MERFDILKHCIAMLGSKENEVLCTRSNVIKILEMMDEFYKCELKQIEDEKILPHNIGFGQSKPCSLPRENLFGPDSAKRYLG